MAEFLDIIVKLQTSNRPLIKISLRAVLPVVGILLSASYAQAQIILIDFGLDSQTTGTVNGNTWNNSSTASSQTEAPNIADLVDSEGDATGISLTITREEGAQLSLGGSDVTGITPTPAGVLYPESATRDQAFNTSLTKLAFITLDNLNDNLTYNLTFFGLTPQSRVTEVTISGTALTYDSDEANGGGWVTFSNITPTSGSITAEIRRAGEISSAVNVMQITAVPEPASAAALIGLASGALLLRRRRKNV